MAPYAPRLLPHLHVLSPIWAIFQRCELEVHTFFFGRSVISLSIGLSMLFGYFVRFLFAIEALE